MRILVKSTIGLVFIIMIVFIFGLIFLTLRDYKPEIKELIIDNKNAKIINAKSFSLLTWNIGYCGLDKEMDFFYDGGKRVQTTKEKTIANLKAITSFLRENDSIDFFLLQEIDINAKRSYGINELDSIYLGSASKQACFAKNYDVDFVPIPIKSPMGKVVSGQAILSSYQTFRSVRNSYPFNYSWPTQIFMLDRCFLVNRYKLENNKQLLVINTHNSAYGDGSLQKKEISFLKSFITKEYQRGNYIIVGGDWNQTPPDYQSNKINHKAGHFTLTGIEEATMPNNWTWVYDSLSVTNRYLNQPYGPNNQTTVLDFFLISPNLNVKSVKTIDLQFQHSDHNPVIVDIELK